MASESRPKSVLLVVTNVAHYADESHPTGLWVSELSHAYDIFHDKGYKMQLVSPKGGNTPLEPKSLKFPMVDASAKLWVEDKDRRALLEKTAKPEDIQAKDYDAIYFTGGHAVMFDFPDNEGLQKLTREIWENGGVVSSVCHGYCGLLNVKLSDGSLLIKDRKVTGFSWNEEVVAMVTKDVPFNGEEEMRKRGAKYSKCLIPFMSNVVVDERLVTGQNPGSAKATANSVVTVLSTL